MSDESPHLPRKLRIPFIGFLPCSLVNSSPGGARATRATDGIGVTCDPLVQAKSLRCARGRRMEKLLIAGSSLLLSLLAVLASAGAQPSIPGVPASFPIPPQ